MLTCFVALIMAAGVFIADQVVSRKRDLAVQLSTLADIIAKNSTAALAFDDAKSASQTLQALSAERNILQARLYTREGRVFASYSAAPLRPSPPLPLTPPPRQPRRRPQAPSSCPEF